jgi:hypothetical protein
VELFGAVDLPNTKLRTLLKKRFPCQHIAMATSFFVFEKIATTSTHDTGPKEESRSLIRSSQSGGMVGRCLWMLVRGLIVYLR